MDEAKPSYSHRDALVHTAVALFRKQGYAATGINQILKDSGAPKGSLYYYFPGGKAQIGAAAVALAATTVQQTLAALAATSATPGALIVAYVDLLAGWMRQSDFSDGSPIATILLETAASDDPIRQQGRTAYRAWAEVIAAKAMAGGMAAQPAGRLARFAIAAIEGALIQCRTEHDAQPLLDAAETLSEMFDRAAHGLGRP